MAEELTTRDVFQQVDARLTRVEDDLRDFRKEVSGRFDRLEGEIDGRFDRLQGEMNSRFDRLQGEMNSRFDRLQGEMSATFRWLIGLILVSWLSLMVSIWLK